MEGEITTFGSRMFENHVPDRSVPTVARLLEAGAIMHARTTTPEMAHAPHCRSDLWGNTRNPWNLDFGPGGSSGGAAAAVAAGMTTLADGTDGGGSIRMPAACCGHFGYKPPFGRNPIDRAYPRESLLHYGPMTRSVADGALMQNVMAGPHPDDICSIRPKLEIPDELEPIEGWKVRLLHGPRLLRDRRGGAGEHPRSPRGVQEPRLHGRGGRPRLGHVRARRLDHPLGGPVLGGRRPPLSPLEIRDGGASSAGSSSAAPSTA